MSTTFGPQDVVEIARYLAKAPADVIMEEKKTTRQLIVNTGRTEEEYRVIIASFCAFSEHEITISRDPRPQSYALAKKS